MERVSNIRLIKNKEESIKDEEQEIILNDFYNSLEYSYKFESQAPELVYLFEQIEVLLESRVYASYEDAYRRQTKEDIVSIIKDNNEYEKELIQMIQEMESREHMSFVDYVFIMGAKAAMASKDRLVTQGAFTVSDVRTKADHNIIKLRNAIFKSLNESGVNLGTKTESKTDTNSRIAKTIYDIVCYGKQRKEFEDYCTQKKTEEELSPNMKLLVKRLGIEDINKISAMSNKRDFAKESLLLMYIILSDIYKYNPNLIEDCIDEDRIEGIKLKAENDVDESRDKLCLRYNIKV